MRESDDPDTLYRRLGLRPKASRAEIVRAYRRLVRAAHPDAHPGDPHAARRFREIQEAYEGLSDPARRASYDQRRQSQGATTVGVPLRPAAVPLLVGTRSQWAPAPTPPGAVGTRPAGAADVLRAGPVHVTPLAGPGHRDAARVDAAPRYAAVRAVALVGLWRWR